MKSPARVRVAGAALAMALVASFVGAGTVSAGENGGDVNPTTLLTAETEPAVQFIENTATADLAVPDFDINGAAVSALIGQLAAQVVAGQVGRDDTSIGNAFVEAVFNNPAAFFSPNGQTISDEFSIRSSGTGFVVTPDGYMVTASHLVNPTDTDLKSDFAEQALADFNQQSVDALVTANQGDFSEAQLDRLGDAVEKLNENNLQIGEIKKETTAQLGAAEAGGAKGQKETPVEVIDGGEPADAENDFDARDVAVVKLGNQRNLPTVSLGEEADVNTGETLYVVGYNDSTENFDQSSQVQPTLYQGPLTAKKTNAKGVPVFVSQIPTRPGTSGSPVLDDQGNVVAMVSTGLSESEDIERPVGLIRQKLNERNIRPVQSVTAKEYNEGLESFFDKHYKDAIKNFQQVKRLYPAHPFVDQKVSESQTAISAGNDETPSDINPLIFVIAGVLLLGVVLLIVLLVARRGRNKGRGPAPAYAGGGGPGGWATGPGGPGGPPPGSPPGYPPTQPSQPQPQWSPPPTSSETVVTSPGAGSTGGGGPAAYPPSPTGQPPPQQPTGQQPAGQQSEGEGTGKFCANCGATRAPGAQFCGECGNHF